MLRVLWLTLMWLVAFAVPVQGYAAVAMAGCGPGHHGSAGVQSQSVATGHHHAAESQLSVLSHDEMPGDHLHDGSVGADHAHLLKAHGATSKVAKGSCTPCASCCVVAALPAAMIVFQAIPLVDFFVQLAPRELASFLTEGPERPPRFILV